MSEKAALAGWTLVAGQYPSHLNITEYIEAHAPVPYLEIGIRQNGRLLDTTYNVQPGTPLEMVIYLDQKSKCEYCNKCMYENSLFSHICSTVI
ncbi:hypothetical protein BIW11_02259 [Tropilaelaps mercedesae]|uniref:Uncharacterized protein n=1 Tax=Tropilaelaps mercedesae TaxID=418985 RepID=A0A1V9X0H6_9ACAR|nr:hypothetical protein BIW11_02259 [Tropilaelaps mercedesae]